MRPLLAVAIVIATGLTLAGVPAEAFASIPASIPASVPASSPQLVPAVSTGVGTKVGIDVSFPQCADANGKADRYGIDHVAYPSKTPFAIVGVNHGIASTFNSCFVAEYNDAQSLPGTAAWTKGDVYINTGNPGLTAVWWPSSNTTENDGTVVVNPEGTCEHLHGKACAYIYGYSMAQNDVDYLRSIVGTGPGTIAALPTMFWLDVETTNSWSPSGTTSNRSSIRGMVDYLKTEGLAVGIYSTSYQWGRIAGAVSSASAVAGLPSWLAGTSPATAPKDCEKDGLTSRSRVWMLQYVYSFDEDYGCGTFPSAAATIAKSGTQYVGTKLVASRGTWASGTVSYRYEWLRNGVAIPRATSSTHTTTSSDRGKTITVKITARADGYRTTSVVSAGALILGKITSRKVSISGTDVVGKQLTAHRGTWSPSGVTYSYAWFDGTTPIPDATRSTYTLTANDLGQQITVKVTGTKPGYLTVIGQSTPTAVVAAAS